MFSFPPHCSAADAARRARTGLPGRGRIAVAGLVLLALVPFVSFAAQSSPQSQSGNAAVVDRDFDRVLSVGATEVFYPYSFRDESGMLQGFGVDVMDAVAKAMNLKIRRVVVTNVGVEPALRSGQLDLVQFWSETSERRQWAEFSTPIAISETIILVRKGDRRIQGPEGLAGRFIAVGQKGNVGDRYLREQQPTAQVVYTSTSEEFLRLLSAGRCDAAVMSRLTALSMIDKLGLKNLEVLDAKVPGYDVRYCFAVRRGDSLLLARLNEGLAVIRSTGRHEFDDIYLKWFGDRGRGEFTKADIATFVAIALALVCAAVTWGLVRQRTLRRSIARQAEELAEQRSLLAALHEKHPVATLVLELSPENRARLVSLNPEAVRLLGLHSALVAGRDLGELELSADWRQHLDEVVARWHAAPHADHWESRLPGHQMLLETSLVPLGTSASGSVRLCVLVADMTRRRLLDHEISQSRRLRALGELVGGIAHEFNNLLTPIIATTNLLQLERRDDTGIQHDLGMIDEAAKRAAELTRRLLTFGRKSDERAQAVSLADSVQNCFSLLRPTIDRRIEWENRVPKTLPPVFFNPTDLHQIVFNLVLNARDTLIEKLVRMADTEWTPRIALAADELAAGARPDPAPRPGQKFLGWQHLSVADNGLGIPTEHLERIFEPFFTTKDVGKGTGLGLATIWHLVHDAGGEVTVESRPGEGSCFHVFLPRWENVDTAPVPEKRATDADGLKGTPRRVLLVEDDPLVARAAVAVLERLGHSVTHLLDGVEAWSHLSMGVATYDLLLLDVNMPRMNGVELVRRLRGANVPGRIVVTSGRLPEAEMRSLRELGVDQFLVKPFTPTQLVAVLEGDPAVSAV